ncbi:MAG: PilW family protein [Gemmatimonadaceae bacterium]
MRLTPRRAATLVELVVVMALGGTLSAIMLSMVLRQQRFHTGTAMIVAGKRSARDATELLARELRPLSTVPAAITETGSDIYDMSDSAITFRAHAGASVICAIDPSRTTITLPSTSGPLNERLTTFLGVPRGGDSLFIFDRGATPSRDDDAWHRSALVSDPGGGNCPLRPAGLAVSDIESTSALALRLTVPVPPGIDVGAPIRFFRPTTYSLYRTSAGDWALGSATCAAGRCSARQPVSGPYQARSSGSPPGLTLEYYDVTGAETDDRNTVARIDLIARTRSATALDVAHIRSRRYHDSLATSIAVRNGG